MAAKKPTKKAAAKKPTAKKPAAKRPPPAAPNPPPRTDKGEGEGAVRARIASLKPPVRDIMEKLHPLVMRLAPDLEPTVKWGHAVYLKRGRMVLVAAPRKSYVGFGHTQVAGIRGLEPVDFHGVDEVTEARVAAFVAPLRDAA
jgi:hypothetical protein